MRHLRSEVKAVTHSGINPATKRRKKHKSSSITPTPSHALCFLYLLSLITAYAREHHCHLVAVDLLPLWRLFQLQAQHRGGAQNGESHAVLVEWFLPAREAADDADVLAHEIVAVHVDTAVDID